MTEYQLRSPGRHCCATGRELQPGEEIWTALVEEGGEWVRREYAADAWTGPPPGVFSYWHGRLPPTTSKRPAAADDELLLELFHRLAETAEPAKLRFRYVVALLLLRRKKLKYEDSERTAGGEVLIVRDSAGERHAVADPGLAEDELADVQDEVLRLLE